MVGDTDRTGTTITFLPDDTIFYVTEYKYDILSARLRELAYLNKGIRLSLTDKREIDPETNAPRHEVFFSQHGLSEFVEYLDNTRGKTDRRYDRYSDRKEWNPCGGRFAL